MADEGIMALSQGMQGKQPQRQQQAVTSADSYDAAQTALGRVNPGEQAALKEALRQNIGNLQLTPQQLDALIQVLEYVSQHPGDYKNLLQKMLEAGVLDEGDMPPEYDPEFIGTMLAVLNEMQQMQAAGAQEPMDLSPVVQGLQPMGMASGGLADIGQYLASKGRGGDSMLAHINPEEAAMLKRRGGSGTINPNTGLPEFKEGALGGVFDAIGGALKGVANVAKDLLKSPVGRILGTIALATVLGPAGVGLTMSGATAAGLAGAGVSVLGGGSMKEALISGAMGYIGGGGTVMGVNPVEAVGSYLPGAAGGALNTGLATGLIGAGIGKLGGMSTEDALQMGLTSGVSAGGMKAFVGDPESYAMKSKMLTLAEAGDPSAAAELVSQQPFASNNAGPGLKVPPMGSSMAYDPTLGNFKTGYDLYNPAASNVPGMSPTVGEGVNLSPEFTKVPGMDKATGAGVRFSPEFTNADLARGVGGTGGGTNYGFRPVPPTSTTAAPTGFFDKMVTGAGEMYNTYLSPDRAGLPSDVSFFRKYGPLAAAGTATIAAFGGMDSSPAEIDPITAGERARYAESRLRAKARRDRIEKGGYGLEGNRPSSYLTPPAAPLIYAANGGYIGHYAYGGDVDERRQLVLERQAGYGLEGNQLSTAPKRKRKVVKLPPVTIFDGGGGNDGGGGGGSGGLPGYGAYGNQGAFSNFLSNIGLTSAGQAVATDLGNQLNPGLTLTGADISGGQFSAPETSPNPSTGLQGQGTEGQTGLYGDAAAGMSNTAQQGFRAGELAERNAFTEGITGALTSRGISSPGAIAGGIASLGGGSIDAVENAIAQDISNAKMEAAAMKAADAAQYGPQIAIQDARSAAAQTAALNAALSAAESAAADTSNSGGFTSGANPDGYGGGDLGAFLAKGGPARMTHFPRRDGPINGRGTGTSDDIPAMLSDGEFVFTAKAVRNAGGGSRRKGAARMYKLMKKLEGGAVKGN